MTACYEMLLYGREALLGRQAHRHCGALRAGGTPDGRSKGGLVTAERRRARAVRDEAIDDAVTGHIEKLSAIMGQLVPEASNTGAPSAAVSGRR